MRASISTDNFTSVWMRLQDLVPAMLHILEISSSGFDLSGISNSQYAFVVFSVCKSCYHVDHWLYHV